MSSTPSVPCDPSKCAVHDYIKNTIGDLKKSLDNSEVRQLEFLRQATMIEGKLIAIDRLDTRMDKLDVESKVMSDKWDARFEEFRKEQQLEMQGLRHFIFKTVVACTSIGLVAGYFLSLMLKV